MRQIINIGASDNDPIADTIRSGGDKINQNFEELYSYQNRIIHDAGFTIVGLTFTLLAGWIWEIGGVQYTNDAPISIPITLAASGKKRQDIVQLLIGGNCSIKKGIETSDFPPKPSKDADAIEATDFPVNDVQVGDPTPPITGEPYVKKEFFSEIFFSLTGDVDAYAIGAQFGHYIFKETGAMTSFSSLNLFNSAIYSYVGKWLILENRQTTAIPIRHNSGTGTSKFIMPSGVDYYLQPGEKIITTFTRELTAFGSFKFLVSSNKGATIAYVDEKVLGARTAPQFNITGNITINNSHNGSILKIKSTCTITILTGLIDSFSCVARTFAGATATWVEGSDFTIDAPKGKIQDPLRLVTFVKDGNLNSGFLEGGMRL